MPEENNSRARRAVALGVAAGLVLLTLAVLGRILGYGFVEFDDDIYVTGNPSIRLGLGLAGLRWAFTTLYAAFWHPVTWLSLLADYQVAGLDGRFFHLTNLLLHIANTVLLFWLLRRMTGSVWRSGIVAALFAVHPLHVESVAWIAERKDVLSTFFGLLALGAYVRYAAAGLRRWYGAALLLFAVSLAAKPMLVTMPALLAVLDYWPLARWRTATLRRLALEKLPFLALGLAASGVAVMAQRASGALPLEPGPLWFRLANAVLSYGRYLAKMVWPSGLAPFYPWSDRLPLAPVLGSLALLLAVTGLAFGQARKRPWLIAGWAWYGLALLPVCGLIRVGSHAWADRYSYLPLAGVWVALAWEAGARVSGRPRARAVLAVLAGSAVLACALAAWRQAGYWRDTAVLFRHTLAVTGPNPMIESNLAAVLYKRGEGEAGLVHARRAVMLNPDNSSARNNLGVLLNAAGNPEEAVVHYAKAVDLAPAYAEARANLGGVLLQRGRVDEAVPHLEQAAALKPDDDKTLANLGSARFFQGRLDEAAGFYLRALAVRPDSATAAFNLGAVRERQGRYAEAADWFGKAVALKPGDAEARRRLEAVRLRVP